MLALLADTAGNRAETVGVVVLWIVGFLGVCLAFVGIVWALSKLGEWLLDRMWLLPWTFGVGVALALSGYIAWIPVVLIIGISLAGPVLIIEILLLMLGSWLHG